MNVAEWPAERAARLIEMWADPDLSQRAIGRALGVSAGAVGSKARRMGLGPKAMHDAARMHAACTGAVRAANARRVALWRLEAVLSAAAVPVPPTRDAEEAVRRSQGEAPLPAFHPISWGVLRPRPLVP